MPQSVTSFHPPSQRRKNIEDLRRRNLTVLAQYETGVLLTSGGIGCVQPFYGSRHDARDHALTRMTHLRSEGWHFLAAVFRRCDDTPGVWLNAQIGTAL